MSDDMVMTTGEREAVLAIALLAAMADGSKSDAERERVKATLDGLAPSELDLAGVYERALTKRTTAAREASALRTPAVRRAAYEMAVAVCDADDTTSRDEGTFLDELARALEIPAADAGAIRRAAENAASADVRTPAALPVPVTPVPAASAPGADPVRREVDSTIMTHAVLCGALELLPQGLASAAIIPIQMKMVYSIGSKYGYSLDRGHITDFLATVGVGATSQIVEGYARKIVGGFLERAAKSMLGGSVGGWVGSLAPGALGVGMSFATTYALGRVAAQYYAGGRTFGAIDLRGLFGRELTTAKQAYASHLPQIREQASKLNPATVLSSLGVA
ncbi:MAG: DUF533 domain-containing protein [Planctomycetota bacterium]|nr:DUF533 domain-containing protein [Planctomycetota bacterium]